MDVFALLGCMLKSFQDQRRPSRVDFIFVLLYICIFAASGRHMDVFALLGSMLKRFQDQRRPSCADLEASLNYLEQCWRNVELSWVLRPPTNSAVQTPGEALPEGEERSWKSNPLNHLRPQVPFRIGAICAGHRVVP